MLLEFIEKAFVLVVGVAPVLIGNANELHCGNCCDVILL